MLLNALATIFCLITFLEALNFFILFQRTANKIKPEFHGNCINFQLIAIRLVFLLRNEITVIISGKVSLIIKEFIRSWLVSAESNVLGLIVLTIDSCFQAG